MDSSQDSMKVRVLRVVAATVLVAGCSRGPVLEEVLHHASRHALHAERVDWAYARERAYEIRDERGGEAGRVLAIRKVIQLLGDGHSHYLSPDMLAQRRAAATRPEAASREQGSMPPIAQVEPAVEGFGHLVVNAWAHAQPDKAAGVVRAALATAVAQDACGVIVDVAHNVGGDVWPMLAGVAPLLDAGRVVAIQRRGADADWAAVQDGVVNFRGRPATAEPLPPIDSAPRHIALVIGSRTASSGEMLALAFRHQAHVRSFGIATRGLSTSNSTFPLSNGGILALTTGRLLDRRGIVQEGPLQPDEWTAHGVEAAARWLSAQCREGVSASRTP